jgi:hypothetical protein
MRRVMAAASWQNKLLAWGHHPRGAEHGPPHCTTQRTTYLHDKPCKVATHDIEPKALLLAREVTHATMRVCSGYLWDIRRQQTAQNEIGHVGAQATCRRHREPALRGVGGSGGCGGCWGECAGEIVCGRLCGCGRCNGRTG